MGGLEAVVLGVLHPGVNRATWVALNAVLLLLCGTLLVLAAVAPEAAVHAYALLGINLLLLGLANVLIFRLPPPPAAADAVAEAAAAAEGSPAAAAEEKKGA